MNTNWREDSTLPSDVREGLAKFCDQLQAALADKLVAVILYGGLAKGEFVPGRSDVNVMVVLKEATIAVLDQAAPILQSPTLGFRLTSMLLTEQDLPHACEVFPTKFLDIQRHHRLLWGQDVACNLPIPRDRLRRQCARELMNLQLRLRPFYLQRRNRPELIESTLLRSLSTVLFNLSVIVELKIGQAPPTKAAIVEAAEKLGFNAKLLRDLLALKRGESKPDAAELKQLYGGIMQTVGQAVAILDML